MLYTLLILLYCFMWSNHKPQLNSLMVFEYKQSPFLYISVCTCHMCCIFKLVRHGGSLLQKVGTCICIFKHQFRYHYFIQICCQNHFWLFCKSSDIHVRLEMCDNILYRYLWAMSFLHVQLHEIKATARQLANKTDY